MLALAISSEEDDRRIYRGFAASLRDDFAVFDGMATEEESYAQRLMALHDIRLGNVSPLIRREHVAEYHSRKPVWLAEALSLDDSRDLAGKMEQDVQAFAQRAPDADTRALLNDLATAEAVHEGRPRDLMRHPAYPDER